jgi:hypothetical protein
VEKYDANSSKLKKQESSGTYDKNIENPAGANGVAQPSSGDKNINKRPSFISEQVPKALKLTKKINEILSKVDKLDFDIFDLQCESKEDEIPVLMNHIFTRDDIFNALNIRQDVFFKFTRFIQGGYKPIAYHNKTHGADVT